MILRIVLFLSYGMLVSSNNGYPIIPTQRYPIYQQNGYASPSANQPSDITPYSQSMMVQNQSPPLDLSLSNIRQILLNRILLGQPMQTIFHQNPIGYGSNLVDFPNNAMVPNAVNNYFAAPMVNEYVNNQPTGANKEDKVADNKTEGKRKKHKKRKSSKSKRHHDSEKNQISSSKHDKSNNLKGGDKELSIKSKKRSRKLKIEAASHENHTKTIENESNKKTKKKKRKNETHDLKNPAAEETKVEESKPRRRHKKKLKQDNAEYIVSEQQTTPKPNQIQEGINLANYYEGIVEENRVPRNPIAEGNDLFKSIPNLPENIANSFNLKGLSQFNNPAMGNFFANYENIYQSMMANNKGTNDQREVIRIKPKRRNKNKTKIEVKNKNSTVTKATVQINPTKPIVNPKINIVTTEKTIYIIEKTRTNIDTIPKDLKASEKPSQVKEAIHEFENDEIKDMESNIKDPVLNYGYIDDYYPQFMDSAAYPTANNREAYIKNLGDTKYYYAVDKENPELINRMRFEGFGLPERVTKDYEVNKKYNDAEKEDVSNALKPDSRDIKEEVIQFRSPPQLEIPDFQTREIVRNEINSQPFYNFDENDDLDQRFLGNKAIYSEAKVPCYAGAKDNSKKVQKDKHKDVETVFARSKVVKYGPGYNPEDDSTSGICNQDLTDDTSFKDGGTTYVMATSLDYPEMFW